MYRLKNKIHFKNQRETAKQIGIAPETLSRILSGKQVASKMTAYCITKVFDESMEIDDLFIKVE